MKYTTSATRASFIPAVTVALIFLYPWAHFVPLVGNLSLIDVVWFGVFVASLFVPGMFGRLFRLYASSYGVLCLFFAVLLLLSTLLSSDVSASVAGFLQLAFILLITVPLAAVSISYLQRPLNVLLGACAAYLYLYLAGLVLFLAGEATLVTDTGAHRYDPVWRLGYHMLSISGAIWLSRITFGGRGLTWAYVGLTSAAVAIVFTGSRAAAVSLVLSVSLAIMLMMRARRVVKATLVTATGGLIVWFYLGGGAQSYLASVVPILTRNVFDNPDRFESYRQGLGILLDDWKVFALGTGLGTYTIEDQVVHNIVLQIAIGSGVFAAITLAAILVLPFWQLWRQRVRFKESRETLGGVFIWISLVPFFLGHPVSYERVFWLPFAFVLGLTIRARAEACAASPHSAVERSSRFGPAGSCRQKGCWRVAHVATGVELL